MMKRAFLLLSLLVTLFIACGGATEKQGALVAIISTDISIADMNKFRIEVSQETAPGIYGAPLIAKDFPILAENTLPATFTISSGKRADQNALVRVIGSKDTTPVVLREVEVLVPNDRVLALPMMLAHACAGQVSTDPSGRVIANCPANQSCQPATGTCGSDVVDDGALTPYGGITGGANGGDAAAPIGADEKSIESFELAGVPGTISGTDIFVALPPTTTNTNPLAPTINWRGAKIDPDPSVPQLFTSAVQYTVTAQDGTQAVYTVHVSLTAPDSKEIVSFEVTGGHTLFNLIGPDGIEVDVPSTFDVKHVTPTIAIIGKSVSPASLVEQDFTKPITYTVTAYDGSTRSYLVEVDLPDPTVADITSFTINGVDGFVADGTDDGEIPGTIEVSLPGTADITKLTPTITYDGKSLTPGSGVQQDFTNGVQYTVVSGDGSFTRMYTATIKRAQVPDVQFSPMGGNYGHPIDVKLSCAAAGAKIYYNTNAAQDPTQSDTLFTAAAPIHFGIPSVAKTINARCFAAGYDPAQQSTFNLFTVTSGTFDAPEEIDFPSTGCGKTAAAKTFTLSNSSGTAYTYTTAARTGAGFTVSPATGTAATSGTTITVTPNAVPAKPDTLDDITEVLDFTFNDGGSVRSVSLRMPITCP